MTIVEIPAPFGAIVDILVNESERNGGSDIEIVDDAANFLASLDCFGNGLTVNWFAYVNGTTNRRFLLSGCTPAEARTWFRDLLRALPEFADVDLSPIDTDENADGE